MEKMLETMKALGEPNRLRAFLALTRLEELCLCEIAEFLGITPSTASRHMSLLLGAKLVTCRKKGKWVYYQISPLLDSRLLQWIQESLYADSRPAEDLEKIRLILEEHKQSCCPSGKNCLSKSTH